MHARLALLAAATLLLGLSVAGCGHKSGKEVTSAETYNLRVTNVNEHTLTVYVDGAKLGSVAGYEEDDYYSDSHYGAPEGFFWVRPGFHEVEFRFGNDLQSRVSQGHHEFTNDTVVELIGGGLEHRRG